MFKRLVFLFMLLMFAHSSNAVPTPNKCKSADSDCLKQSARAFLPLLADGGVSSDLKPLDPLFISKIESSSQTLRFMARDVKVKGLRECKVDSVKRDADKSKLSIRLVCSFVVDGEYEIKGKVLDLPLDGQGHLGLIFKNTLINIDSDLIETELNGQKHWDLKNWNLDYTVQEKANIQLSNLFNGNVKPTPEIQETVGASLTQLIAEISPPVIKAIVTEGLGTVSNYFHLVPSEDLTFD